MIERIRAVFARGNAPEVWPEGGNGGAAVVAVCHPEWRGVRVAAHGHGVPVIEVADAGPFSAEIVSELIDRDVRVLVVQGWPPGSGRLITAAAAAGLATRCVLHSSMAQHGAEVGESAVMDEVVGLLHAGMLGRLGFVKEGQAEAFTALGHDAFYVPNRIPPLPTFDPLDLGSELQVGVFAEPFWRKNVNTQLGAAAMLDAVPHVLHRPESAYLRSLRVEEHGVLPRDQYIQLQGSMDLNLYVTLSECFPLTPLESYAAGVPCLMSRTSAVFRSDPELWELTTVDEADNPRAIADAARRLLPASTEAIDRASTWMVAWDAEAAARWGEFVAV